MKVKKLEWYQEVKSNALWSSKFGLFIIKETPKIGFIARSNISSDIVSFHILGYFKTLEQAQEACQKHFEQFILSQIEVKAFDPTLLGFIESDPNKLYKLATKIYCLGDFDLLPIKGKWFLNHPKKGWLFRGLDIPDHDFGVKLISQFLGVE